MSRIRSKRNFKALQLDVSAQPMSAPEPDPISTRPAPASKPAAGGAKKRPPPMNLKPKTPADPSASDGGGPAGDGIVAVSLGSSSAPPSAVMSASAKRMTYHTTLSNKLASLDMSAVVKYDLRDEDLKDLNELGQGNGGSVKKVEHVPTHTIMAKKVFLLPTLPPPSFVVPQTNARSLDVGRSSSSTRSLLCASRSCASCRSCTTVTRNTSFRSMARSCPIPTSAFAWSLWTRVHSTGFTNA